MKRDLFNITFTLFQTLTIIQRGEALQLTIENIIEKQQELYPILTCIRTFSRIKALFKILKNLNKSLCKIANKFGQIKMEKVHTMANKPPLIFGIEKILIDNFDLQEVLLDTIVLHNKLHDQRSLNLMYNILSKIYDIQNQLYKNYRST